MDSPSLASTLTLTLTCAALTFGLGGCTVHAARPMVYGSVAARPVYVEPAPVATYDDYVYDDSLGDVEAHPYVVYQGTPTYYVQGRWYRRTARGWAYYRTEPQPLYGQRPIVAPPPPAYGAYGSYGAYGNRGGYVNTAPPVFVNTAPPARRYTNTAPPARRWNTAPPAH